MGPSYFFAVIFFIGKRGSRKDQGRKQHRETDSIGLTTARKKRCQWKRRIEQIRIPVSS